MNISNVYFGLPYRLQENEDDDFVRMQYLPNYNWQNHWLEVKLKGDFRVFGHQFQEIIVGRDGFVRSKYMPSFMKESFSKKMLESIVIDSENLAIFMAKFDTNVGR